MVTFQYLAKGKIADVGPGCVKCIVSMTQDGVIRKGNIRIMSILKGEEKEQGLEHILRQIVDKIFPKYKE